MDKVSISIELESELKQKIEEIAEQMGFSVSEWCAFAVGQQVLMQEQMENLFDQVGQLGFDLGQMDFDTITNELFNNVIDIDSFDDEDEDENTPKLILPDHIKRNVKED